MIDKSLIERKIDIILENLKYLQDVKEIQKDSFLASFEKIQATKHSLQESIEACIDIANHVIASMGFERAETYADMFERLAENGIIGKKLRDKLMNMAKFRNLLVHAYGKIDIERLWGILQEDLEDILSFVKEIERFLEENE
ncbi:MAG: DUF86 domain-containing protein [Thermoplasmata archaeon]|nr:MAG: DUF86 domain-containing protein [Thermoplasmata archaeon]KAA0008849.1 MAG: DUF86 domain-containing protein [Thermoplasmata archaeon]